MRIKEKGKAILEVLRRIENTTKMALPLPLKMILCNLFFSALIIPFYILQGVSHFFLIYPQRPFFLCFLSCVVCILTVLHKRKSQIKYRNSKLIERFLLAFFHRFNPNITSSGGEKYGNDKTKFERKDQEIK